MTTARGLVRRGGVDHEGVADSVPVRRDSQGMDVRKSLQGGCCEWDPGGALGGEAQTETGGQIIEGPVGN